MSDAVPPPPLTTPARHKAPGIATASLILGLLSFLFSILTGIPAIACGHKALTRIKKSGGLMDGKGRAITGLVTGYLSIAFLVLLVPIMAGLAVPVFARVQENGNITRVINDAHQVYYAIELYKSDNDGTYPATLQELTENYELPAETISASSYPGFTYDGGAPHGQLFHYFPAAPDAPPSTVILLSDCSFSAAEGQIRRVVGKLDGSVGTERFPEGSLPQP